MPDQCVPNGNSKEGAPSPQDSLEPCPDCGRLLSRSATVCPNCGHPFPLEAVSDTANQYAGLAVLAGLCKCLGVLVLLFFICRIVFVASQTPVEIVVLASLIDGIRSGLFSLVLWSLGELIQLLIDVKRDTSAMRQKAMRRRRVVPARLELSSPEDLQALRKLSDDLASRLESSKEVLVLVELTAPVPLGTAEASKWHQECGLQVIDNRASYRVLFKYPADTLRGRIQSSRLLDLARLPRVQRVSSS
jgi:hypothetical protein